MQTKFTAGIILLVAALISVLLMTRGSLGDENKRSFGEGGLDMTTDVGEAKMKDGVQYIDITARGGYAPRVTKAVAGLPAVIRVKTNNSYDCSIALTIPDIGYQSYLPQTGVTEIVVPAERAQGTLRGMCSMAMYHFQIDFE